MIFLQILKIIVENSPIAHSIGNFDKTDISRNITSYKIVWRHNYTNMTLYLARYQFYRKKVRIKVFQYKISNRMSELCTIILKFCKTRHFNGKFNQNCLSADRKNRLFWIFFHSISYNWWDRPFSIWRFIWIEHPTKSGEEKITPRTWYILTIFPLLTSIFEFKKKKTSIKWNNLIEHTKHFLDLKNIENWLSYVGSHGRLWC